MIAKSKFASPNEFLNAVRRAELTDVTDPRLQGSHEFATAGSDEHGIYSNPYGGFLVPVELSPSVQSIASFNPTDQFVRIVQSEAYTVNVPARFEQSGRDTSTTGGLVVNRRAETSQSNATRAKFHLIKLEPRALEGFTYATEELLEGTQGGFQQLLAQSFAEEIAWKTLDERINGDGVNKPLGALNAPCRIEVAKESGQTATTIEYSNITKMMERVWDYRNAVWFANHDCLRNLLDMVDSQNNRCWLGDMDFFMGRPLYTTEFCRTLGTAGDILLANWGEYVVAIRGQFQGVASVHCRFVQHEQAFRFWLNIDSAPWWQTALTPKYGANTLSPFVTLATRS